MDDKFNSAAACQLIRDMDRYCQGVQKEARELLDIVGNPGGWSDGQMVVFRKNVNEIAIELNQVLKLESEYMRTFYQRVRELTE